jgi:hypothetical protein
MKKKYVLWIEDDATYNLQHIASPVVMNPRYDLTLAVTVSEALHHLQSREAGFDAVIVDLRMPPGKRSEWVRLHQNLGRSGNPPRLGLHLLLSLYGVQNPHLTPIPRIPWLPPIEKVGVLSVDAWTDVQEGLLEIGLQVRQYEQKSAGMSSQILLKLVERVVNEK